MNTLIITFSGRNGIGNCLSIANYIKNLDHQAHTIIDFKDLHVHPCSQCNYDCFSSDTCLFEDDMDQLYSLMLDHSKIILVTPIYNSFAPSLYLKFKERLQGFIKRETYSQFESIPKQYIVIGNKCSGANAFINWLLEVEHLATDQVLLLESTVVKMSSIREHLVEHPFIQNEISYFLKN